MSTAVLDKLGALPFDAAAPIWADVKPVPQSDTDSPLCPILYAPEYSKAMDLLRALMERRELSMRVLALTEHLVKLNPSNYTVWDYRARVLLAAADGTLSAKADLGSPGSSSASQVSAEPDIKLLEAELDLLDEMAVASMKNYQIWQQRKRVVSALGDPSRELDFTAKVLQNDAKNYHTWVYRQWVLCHFGGLPSDSALRDSPTSAPVPNALSDDPGSISSRRQDQITQNKGRGKFPHLWDGERAYIDQLLAEDVLNNSAWNHRYFVFFASGRARASLVKAAASTGNGAQEAEELSEFDVIQSEAVFAADTITKTPHNASAWNYLRGVLRLSSYHPRVEAAARTVNALIASLIPTHDEARANPSVDGGGRTSWHALEWLLDAEEAVARSLQDPAFVEAQGKGVRRLEDVRRNVETILARLLIADPMRKRYWHYKAERILALL